MIRLALAFAALLGLLILAPSVAAAADDPLICSSARAEWRATDRTNRTALETFRRRIPSECADLRAEVSQVFARLPPPAAAPNPSYSGRNYIAELEGCTVLQGGAECTVWVTSGARLAWHFTETSYLADATGGGFRVVEMTIGSERRSVVNQGYRVQFSYIEPGIRTRIIYRFAGAVDPSNIQALVIAIMGSWTGSTAPLSPIPWRS
ncbi:MAG: hypothetical protein H7124_08205 [Phycisphaerales bacterium]|nr:hypothetical protein [Hyphomonadaceae bacterium]